MHASFTEMLKLIDRNMNHKFNTLHYSWNVTIMAGMMETLDALVVVNEIVEGLEKRTGWKLPETTVFHKIAQDYRTVDDVEMMMIYDAHDRQMEDVE